jgi:hypothetical protein
MSTARHILSPQRGSELDAGDLRDLADHTAAKRQHANDVMPPESQ